MSMRHLKAAALSTLKLSVWFFFSLKADLFNTKVSFSGLTGAKTQERLWWG